MVPVTLSAGDLEELIAKFSYVSDSSQQDQRIRAWLYQAHRHAAQGEVTTIPEKQFLDFIVTNYRPDVEGIRQHIAHEVQAFGGKPIYRTGEDGREV